MDGRLPERLEGDHGLLLRRWTPSDAEQLQRAVTESIDHLLPWMPWAAQEPLGPERRRTMLADWERDWQDGGDVHLGVFLESSLVGGCGVHQRIGCGGLEIGYWIHVDFVGRGLATATARLATSGAFTVDGISHVEIHHDKANEASAGVPRKLGFHLIAEEPRKPEAPAEVGVECRWRMLRDDWPT